MLSRFFIHRPIFAWVVAIFIVLVGVISMRLLPVAAYPSVAPPTINVTASYPGADAATIDETVNSLIEREMNGVDGLMYMSSSALAVGAMCLGGLALRLDANLKAGVPLDPADGSAIAAAWGDVRQALLDEGLLSPDELGSIEASIGS